MGFGLDYIEIAGGQLHTTIDPYINTNQINGALNQLGSMYCAPLNPATLATTGLGSQRIYRYVRYNPVASVAIQAGPALVYFTDETFTTVTPTLAEALGASQNSVAGWLLYNTTQVPSATAAQLNGNCCFIQIGGFLRGAVSPAAIVVGDAVTGAAGSFAGARVAAGTAPGYRVAGYATTAVANGLADFNIPLIN